MVKLTPMPNRTLIVLRNEAKAAREGTLRVNGVDIDMAELLEDAANEIELSREALIAMIKFSETKVDEGLVSAAPELEAVRAYIRRKQ